MLEGEEESNISKELAPAHLDVEEVDVDEG